MKYYILIPRFAGDFLFAQTSLVPDTLYRNIREAVRAGLSILWNEGKLDDSALPIVSVRVFCVNTGHSGSVRLLGTCVRDIDGSKIDYYAEDKTGEIRVMASFCPGNDDGKLRFDEELD